MSDPPAPSFDDAPPRRHPDGDVVEAFAGADLRARINIAEDPGSPAVLSLISSPGSRVQMMLLLSPADLAGLRDMLTRALAADAARRAPDPDLAADFEAWTQGRPTAEPPPAMPPPSDRALPERLAIEATQPTTRTAIVAIETASGERITWTAGVATGVATLARAVAEQAWEG